jgi:hypothetical protein
MIDPHSSGALPFNEGRRERLWVELRLPSPTYPVRGASAQLPPLCLVAKGCGAWVLPILIEASASHTGSPPSPTPSPLPPHPRRDSPGSQVSPDAPHKLDRAGQNHPPTTAWKSRTGPVLPEEPGLEETTRGHLPLADRPLGIPPFFHQTRPPFLHIGTLPGRLPGLP